MFHRAGPAKVAADPLMKIDSSLTPGKLRRKTETVFDLAGRKIRALNAVWNPAQGTPVFTVRGRYTSRGWTEWTQGFQFGMALLHFDATGDEAMLALGREKTVRFMASHVSHVGVHDHGFNNISTYGNLRRLMLEGKIPSNRDELNFTEVALKASGAVQAARHVPTAHRDPWSPRPGRGRWASRACLRREESEGTSRRHAAGDAPMTPAILAAIAAVVWLVNVYMFAHRGEGKD